MSRLVHHIRRSSLTLPNKSHHTTIFHRRHWHSTLSSSSPLIQTSQQEDAVNVRRRRISYNTTTYRGFSSNNLESWWKQHASELKQTPRFNNGDRAILLPQSDKKEDIHPVEHLVEWVWNMVNVPKGFENFFPKNKGSGGKKDDKSTKGSSSSSSSSNDETDKEGSSSSKKDQKENPFGNFGNKNKRKNKAGGGGGGAGGGGSGGGFPGGDGPNDKGQVGAAAALLLLVLAARSILDEEGMGSGREVTWSEFRNYMLEYGDVERIYIVNKKTARVVLRPGARGVPLTRTLAGRSGSSLPMSGSSSSASSGLPKRSSMSKDADWEDGTMMDMGPSSSTTPTSASGRILDPTPQQTNQLVYHFNIGSVESFEEKLTAAQKEMNVSPREFVPVQYVNETNWSLELIKAAPALLMVGIMAFMFMGGGAAGGAGGRGGMGGIFQIGKSNAKKINKEDISVTFKDVAGCQEAKKEIMEFVDFLQDSTRFTKLGAKIPKGALLCGPPGTGKTLLAKAVAGEADVPFFSISGSDFIEMFVGVGPSRVRDLFKEARANAPCIVFIDEIDAVGRKRGRGGFSGGNDERENTLNQLLVEMDGFQPSEGVVVLAGTNRVDILDEALTRPGRFDRQITVDKPDLQGRKEIFQVHLKGITLEGEIDDIAGRLAGLTPGFAGADIANICNEAAIVAARRKAEAVAVDDFEKATDRIIGGLESNKIMSKEERSIVAHHEAGHAVAGWFLEHADPLLKVTIIPRSSGALGYAQYLPKEVFLRTQDQIMDIVSMALAGRAAEEIFFGRVTTGASDDLRRVTELVYSTIQVYGMNSRVGQLAFPKDPNAMPGDKPYSDATAEKMDEEARSIVDAAYQRTLDLIRDKKDDVEKVAALLLDKETITHDDIIDLIGPRPFVGDAQYNEFVSRRLADKKADEKKDKKKAEDKEMEENDPLAGGSGGLSPGLA
uniref:AAA+ ATPase domain-containing protein n=1 Tax=Ditylum brightwellii TaxID=49249 RepID=A0A7S2ESD5_9STRA|mmetsp:Transcript_5057/g.7738  ORF Transcript_5057/g.7738 Transcript_5057/m.7738 type:complete len:949 (+) Transcript_5057:433-3279(+)